MRKLTEEAAACARAIRRPNLLLRSAVILFIVSIIGTLGYLGYVAYHTPADKLHNVFMQSMNVSSGIGVYVVGILILLVTAEVRLKRRKALQAIGELRTMAHIIDMDQLSKDQEIERFRQDFSRLKDKFREYLHACTSLLSLLSKIGQLYVENFPDAVAISAVNQFEEVCNGLNTKIWEKIIAVSEYNPMTLRQSSD